MVSSHHQDAKGEACIDGNSPGQTALGFRWQPEGLQLSCIIQWIVYIHIEVTNNFIRTRPKAIELAFVLISADSNRH